MAFRIDCDLTGYEYRGMRSGEGKNGVWVSLVLESPDADQLEVSVPRDLQADVYNLGLTKGDIVSLRVQAACGRTREGNNYDYVRYQGFNGIHKVDGLDY